MSQSGTPTPRIDWNALMEALHSATIDELVERYPEPKPELTLPRQSNEWMPPANATSFWVAEVTMAGGKAAAALAITGQVPGVNAENLWLGVLARAKKEFEIRKLLPTFAAGRAAPPTFAVRVAVWFEFKLKSGSIHLSVNVK